MSATGNHELNHRPTVMVKINLLDGSLKGDYSACRRWKGECRWVVRRIRKTIGKKAVRKIESRVDNVHGEGDAIFQSLDFISRYRFARAIRPKSQGIYHSVQTATCPLSCALAPSHVLSSLKRRKLRHCSLSNVWTGCESSSKENSAHCPALAREMNLFSLSDFGGNAQLQ
jgi:hypothetical protein